jgi:hypothetical protein
MEKWTFLFCKINHEDAPSCCHFKTSLIKQLGQLHGPWPHLGRPGTGGLAVLRLNLTTAKAKHTVVVWLDVFPSLVSHTQTLLAETSEVLYIPCSILELSYMSHTHFANRIKKTRNSVSIMVLAGERR